MAGQFDGNMRIEVGQSMRSVSYKALLGTALQSSCLRRQNS